MKKILALLSLAAAASCAAPHDYSAYNEGAGRYRSAQNALVGQNAPSLPSDVSWSSFGGRRVIVTCLATWNKASVEAARRAEALVAAHPNDLACIHVLSSVDANQAAAYAAKNGLKSTLVADAEGLFRQGLGNDLFPDIYIVRCGKIEGADLKEEEIAKALGY